MKASVRRASGRPRRSESASAASTSGRYCGCCAAFSSSDGLVVASCGVNCRMASMSPVSATTVVTRFRESSSHRDRIPETEYPDALVPMHILVIDIGGTHVKLMHSGQPRGTKV